MTQKAQKWTQMDLWADGPLGVSGIEFYTPELDILIVETFINSFLFNEVNDRDRSPELCPCFRQQDLCLFKIWFRISRSPPSRIEATPDKTAS